MDTDKSEEKVEKPSAASATDGAHCHHNKIVAIVLAVIAIILIVVGMAAVGIVVFHGERGGGKFAKISAERNFGAGKMGGYGRAEMMGGFRGEKRTGIEGKITKVDGNNIVINNGSSDIKVTIQDNTSIYNSTGGIISKTDLKIDNQIVVAGRPDSSGVVQAVLIRIKS